MTYTYRILVLALLIFPPFNFQALADLQRGFIDATIWRVFSLIFMKGWFGNLDPQSRLGTQLAIAVSGGVRRYGLI